MGKGLLRDILIAFQENLVYVIGAGLAVLFVLLLTFTPSLFQRQGSLSSASVDPRSGGTTDIANQIINRNLREDQALLDLRSHVTESENYQHKRRLNLDTAALDLNFDIEAVDPNVYDGSADVYREIYGEESLHDHHLNPRDRIEAKLQRLKMMEQYDFQQKLVFINGFIRNAYEAGYAVEINEQLEVVGIKTIEPDDSYKGPDTIEGLNRTAQ